MPLRSKEEIRFTALLCASLRPLDCSTELVIETLRSGARHGLWDGRFPTKTRPLLFDYDHGHYHGDDRRERDERKSLEALRHEDEPLVLRIRVDAPSLQLPHHPRLLVVDVSTGTTILERWQAVLEQAARAWPDAFGEATSSVAISRRAEEAAREAIVHFNAAEARMLADLAAAFGQLAPQILQVHGVRQGMELGLFIPQLRRLVTTYGIAHAKLPTLLCDGVASGLLREGWLEQLDRLVTTYGIAHAKLPTLLCDGVASGLLREGWLENVARLVHTFEIAARKLPTILGGSLSSILGSNNIDQWFAGVATMRRDLQPSQGQLVVMLGDDSIVRRITYPSFAMSFRSVQRRYGWDDRKAFQQSSLRILCREMCSGPEPARNPSMEHAEPARKRLRLRYKQSPHALVA